MRKLLYIIPLFIFAFTFTGNPPSGWYQQFLPDVGGMPISDIEFLDSLTGFIVTGDGTIGDTNYILKTTNGGDNWNKIFQDYRNFAKIKFISDSIGYVCGGLNDVVGYIYKTTNQGNNWILQNSPFGTKFDDISIINEDTMWVVDNNGFDGGLFRTTNGGVNWTNQYFSTGLTPERIYMVNGKKGYFSTGISPSSKLYQTTNSGINWDTVPGENGFMNMHFIDSLTGWKARSQMKKTTDGGLTWILQTLPSGGIISVSGIEDFSILNKDTIWAAGARTTNRGLIYLTTNGGSNWGYQYPDQSINIFKYSYIDFTSKTHGWAYSVLQGGVHTKIGGDDTTIFLGISQISHEIPREFELFQNYPNPFNPTTNIKFKVKSSNLVRLSVYDITGKEVAVLVNEKLSSGEYEYQFEGTGLSSGIYFYKLETDNYIDTKKMLLIK